MRILVDGYNLGLEQGTGIFNYAHNLCQIIHEIGHKVEVLYGKPLNSGGNSHLREIGFFDAQRPESWFSRLGAIGRSLWPLSFPVQEIHLSKYVDTKPLENRLPYADRLLNVRQLFPTAFYHYFVFGKRLSIKLDPPPDIAHWTFPLPIKIKGAKNIYTIHDLVPLRLPYTTLDNKKYYYKLIKTLTKKADKIITVSDTSRKDLERLFNLNGQEVINTYQAVDIPAKFIDIQQNELANILKGNFDIEPGGYFLFVGAIEPKKNIYRLIEAYLAANLDVPLILAGPKGWLTDGELAPYYRHENVFSSLTGSNKKRVILLGFLSFSMIMYLMKGARALLFPSIYEGFGLPVLEAMSLGTPVLTSNTGSLKEIAGSAAMLVDPYQSSEIRDAIKRLANDANLQRELTAKGIERSKQFSKESYSRRIKNLYSNLC